MTAPVSVALPVAQPPPGVDPATYYAPFNGNIEASWSPATGLAIRLGALDPVPLLHAPLRSISAFVPSGQPLNQGGTPLLEDTLVLKTWVVDYLKLEPELGGPVPALITFSNVDRASAQAAVPDLVAQTPINLDPAALPDITNKYMLNQIKLLAISGAKVGKAGVASASDPGNPTLARRMVVRMYDQNGSELHPVYYLGKFAELAGIDRAVHPLLKLLDFASATDPSLATQLVQIEDPNVPGRYRPADYGIFATLTPKVRIAVGDATAAAGLQVTMKDRFDRSQDISDLFTFDASSGNTFAVLPDSVTDLGVHTLTVNAPFQANMRVMLYSAAQNTIPIDFFDDSYVPTHVPEVTRSDKLIGLEFESGITDEEISTILRRQRVYPVSLNRPWNFVTTIIPSGTRIFDKRNALAEEEQIDFAFIPGNARIGSTELGFRDKTVLIFGEDFAFEP